MLEPISTDTGARCGPHCGHLFGFIKWVMKFSGSQLTVSVNQLSQILLCVIVYCTWVSVHVTVWSVSEFIFLTHLPVYVHSSKVLVCICPWGKLTSLHTSQRQVNTSAQPSISLGINDRTGGLTGSERLRARWEILMLPMESLSNHYMLSSTPYVHNI